MDQEEKRRLYQVRAEVLKALAHPTRLAIVDALREGEKCVCEIAEAVGAEQSNVSRHLALMTRAGVLISRKRGLMVFYRLRTPCVLQFFVCVDGVLQERWREAAVLGRL